MPYLVAVLSAISVACKISNTTDMVLKGLLSVLNTRLLYKSVRRKWVSFGDCANFCLTLPSHYS